MENLTNYLQRSVEVLNNNYNYNLNNISKDTISNNLSSINEMAKFNLNNRVELNQYINNIDITLKYEHPIIVVSLKKNGHNSTKWYLRIDSINKFLPSYILFFDEYKSYFSFGILVI
ncbi:hypothetical protein H8356DRAFT_1325642 [Neocallimastix lanati (nom. inval.)]|nr:hypothetical protein H8356DRAFT_1325642 [Neocallimastix sp. JGI-2020a]